MYKSGSEPVKQIKSETLTPFWNMLYVTIYTFNHKYLSVCKEIYEWNNMYSEVIDLSEFRQQLPINRTNDQCLVIAG